MTNNNRLQDADVNTLCACVSVVLTPAQQRCLEIWPDKQRGIVGGILQAGKQERTYDVDCKTCDQGLIKVEKE